jgi:phosphatidylglycerophosphate synthase
VYKIYKKIVSQYNKSEKKKQDSQYVLFLIYRHLAFPIAALFIYIGISANITTLIGGSLMLISGVLFYNSDSFPMYLGVLFYWIAWILDFTDGVIARYNKTPNYFGKIIDGFVDYLSIFIFIPIAIGNSNSEAVLFLGVNDLFYALVAVMSCHVSHYYSMRVNYFILEMQKNGNSSNEIPVTKRSNGLRSIITFVASLRGNVITAAPVLMLISFFLDSMSYFILFYSIFYLLFLLADVVYKTKVARHLSHSKRLL